jgi:hypothetical protein
MELDHAKRKNRRPIECRLSQATDHFYVTHARGNTLHRGGYGYVVSSSIDEDNNVEVDDEMKGLPRNELMTSALHFLFIEEVLFLFERGLLHAYRADPEFAQKTSGQVPIVQQSLEEETPLSRCELFQLLQLAGISLPTYLVYQHLRAPTYRVVRHTPTRLAILVEQIERQKNNIKSNGNIVNILDETILVEQVNENSSADMARPLIPDAVSPTKRSLQYLKRQLRCDARRAQPPTPGSTIAWDGYHPSASFSAAAPGLPDFYVAITYMTNDDKKNSTLSYRDLQTLLQQTIVPATTADNYQRIPLKIATVSVSGTVLLFGITDYGVPMNHLPLEAAPGPA